MIENGRLSSTIGGGGGGGGVGSFGGVEVRRFLLIASDRAAARAGIFLFPTMLAGVGPQQTSRCVLFEKLLFSCWRDAWKKMFANGDGTAERTPNSSGASCFTITSTSNVE